jgi:hypothetical protein
MEEIPQESFHSLGDVLSGGKPSMPFDESAPAPAEAPAAEKAVEAKPEEVPAKVEAAAEVDDLPVEDSAEPETLETLKRKISGLTKATRAERQKRQELEAKYQQALTAQPVVPTPQAAPALRSTPISSTRRTRLVISIR